jgi:hypothetical protein
MMLSVYASGHICSYSMTRVTVESLKQEEMVRREISRSK